MRSVPGAFAVFAAILLVISPFAAGCLSIPSPDAKPKTSAVTAIATSAVSHTEKVTPAPTPGKTSPTLSVTTTTIPAVTAVQTGEGKYDAGTCSARGGIVVAPGQQCKGTYLAATDTFSCCPVKPVAVGSANASVTVAAFNISVNLDDSPGSILP